jgi:hypothetical protein
MKRALLIVCCVAGCKSPSTTFQNTIGPAGGSVTTSDGTSVVIPVGAVAQDTVITISPSVFLPAIPTVTLIGPAYDFGPAGLVFAKPVSVTLPFDPARIPTGTTNPPAVFESTLGSASTFEAHGGQSVDSTHVAALDITHFSTFVAGVPSASIGTDLGPGECVSPQGTSRGQWVTNAMTVPQQRADFALDLNGDGKVDNQYGNIIGALTAQNLDTQADVNSHIAAGNNLLLFDLQTTDAALLSDPCAGSTAAAAAQPGSAPKFDGTDSFTPDLAFSPAPFKGTLTTGAFNSNAPATTTHPVTLQLKLDVAGSLVRVTLHGAHLQYTVSAGGLMKGQINGAIPNAEVQSTMVPAIATSLTARVTANPTSSNSMQILAIFDTGGTADPACSNTCKNPDGSCAVANDKKIDTCEVGTNSIIKNVLAPDVQLFAADGVTYQPNPSNTMKDSLSVGLGFTAVKAAF